MKIKNVYYTNLNKFNFSSLYSYRTVHKIENYEFIDSAFANFELNDKIWKKINIDEKESEYLESTYTIKITEPLNASIRYFKIELMLKNSDNFNIKDFIENRDKFIFIIEDEYSRFLLIGENKNPVKFKEINSDCIKFVCICEKEPIEINFYNTDEYKPLYLVEGESTVKITEENYEKVISNTNLLVVLYFYSNIFKSSILLKNLIEKMSNTYKGKIRFGIVDIDKAGNLPMKYDITVVPSVIFVKDGKEVSRITDKFKEEELIKVFEKYL